jgi:hypothetical protein
MSTGLIKSKASMKEESHRSCLNKQDSQRRYAGHSSQQRRPPQTVLRQHHQGKTRSSGWQNRPVDPEHSNDHSGSRKRCIGEPGHTVRSPEEQSKNHSRDKQRHISAKLSNENSHRPHPEHLEQLSKKKYYIKKYAFKENSHENNGISVSKAERISLNNSSTATRNGVKNNSMILNLLRQNRPSDFSYSALKKKVEMHRSGNISNYMYSPSIDPETIDQT